MGTTIYTDVMVDIETTGTQPDRAGILQIGAVKFNLETRQVDPNFFDRCLTVPNNRSWSEDTRAWWNQQKPSVLKDIKARAEPHQLVIPAFAQWAYQTPGLRFWAKPTTFDFMFVASYFADAELLNPFHYRNAVDLNSFAKGLFYGDPAGVPTIPARDMGDAHNAVNDCLMQLQYVYDLIDYKEGKYVNPTTQQNPA